MNKQSCVRFMMITCENEDKGMSTEMALFILNVIILLVHSDDRECTEMPASAWDDRECTEMPASALGR